MRYFTSDLHFGSMDTIQFDNRPFHSTLEMEETIIANINSVASADDIVYVIGDFVDYHESTMDVSLEKLALVKDIVAKVILILGNNEERIVKNIYSGDFEKFEKYCLSLGFHAVRKTDDIEISNTEFHLTHKPKNHVQHKLNLFGHSHKAMGIYKSFGFNIGCDLNNYYPYSEDDIVSLLSKKSKYWDHDENLKLV